MAERRADGSQRRAIAALLASAIALAAGMASAQTIHKCVSKEGRTTYSESPCPGSTVVSAPGSSGGALDIDSLTQDQADLAADCLEALYLQDKEGWKGKARDRADFDRYCPGFGFRPPMGDATRDFNMRHGDELLPKLRMRFPDVASGTRTYTGGQRMPPLFFDAARVMREAPVKRRNDIDVTKLPVLRNGKWQAEVSPDGKTKPGQEICGDPLENLRSDLLRSERDLVGMGCAARTVSSSARSVSYVTECPADRSEGGRTVIKGRNEVTVTANSTDSATISIRGPRRSMVAQLVRIGDCAQ